MLEKIISKTWNGAKKAVSRTLCGLAFVGGLTMFAIPKSEASIVENLQTTQTEPIITKLDYRGDTSVLDDVGDNSFAIAQSFLALNNQNYIIDGSLKLKRGEANYTHNMYLKIWPDDNGVPDINNELGTTNALIPKGLSLEDYYLREFGFSAVQVTPGQKYWIGLYNPDRNDFAFGQWSIYSYTPNPYADGTSGNKPQIDSLWEIRSDGIDLGFSITFSNVDEPKLLELLLAGFSLTGLFLNRKLKKKN